MGRNCDIVCGMQYGSEAKGLVVQTLAQYYDLAVRVGGPNAGHTVRRQYQTKDFDGNPENAVDQYKMRHIPATILNPDCDLALAAGSIINPQVLDEEVAMVAKLDQAPDIYKRLMIDPNALVIQPRHVLDEEIKKEGTDLFDLIGSTREGVGAALAERVLRRGGVKLASQEPYLRQYRQLDVSSQIRATKRVVIEGSQGSLLSNIHSPFYPYCTSRDTNASAIAAEAGVPPHAVRHVIGVMRTYPIRVAGRSGPTMGKETTWSDLSMKIGKHVSEQTTVTKRVRRVFEFSYDELRHACTLNSPTIMAVNFLNYLNGEDEAVTDFEKLSSQSRRFIANIEAITQAPVLIMSTSPDHVIVRPELEQMLGATV